LLPWQQKQEVFRIEQSNGVITIFFKPAVVGMATYRYYSKIKFAAARLV